MKAKKVRSALAVVVSLSLVSHQTMGALDIGVLNAAKRAAEKNVPPEDAGGNVNSPNGAPRITKIIDRVIPINSSAMASFQVFDDMTPAQDLKVMAISDRPDFIPANALTISGDGKYRTLTATPIDGAEGTATVTLTVSDAGGLTTKTSFSLSTEKILPYVPGEILVTFRDGAVPHDPIKAKAASVSASSSAASNALGLSSRLISMKPLVPSHRNASVSKHSTQSFSSLSHVPPGGEALASKSLEVLKRTHLIKVDPKADIQFVSELSQADPDVEATEKNLIFTSQAVNDAYFTEEEMWGLFKIKAVKAWEKSKGQGVVVAVLDGGIDKGHIDLSANLWTNSGEIVGNAIDDDGNGYIDDINGWNFANNNNNPQDDNGHGTHVAGTIAAVGENGIGVVGLAHKAKIMPLKGLANGSGSMVDLANGLRYAADNGADVVNMSFGTESILGCTGVIVSAINYAYGKGVTLVAAAGNKNNPVSTATPAGCPNVIAVAATDKNDKKASFSNWGPGIDVAAPGVDILSTVPGNFGFMSGTSMACPHVAGLAALILSQNPTFTNEQVENLIRSTSDDLGEPGVDPLYGYGRINAARALGAIPSRTLTINSTPHGAKVFFSFNDGPMSDSGRVTNTSVTDVPAGKYQIKLVKPGYADWVQTQTLPAVGDILFDATLSPAPGNITVKSTPPGAQIWYSFNDGPFTDSTAVTDITVNNVPVGKYQVKLVKEGYADWFHTMTVGSGESVTFNAILTPTTGNISVHSTPPGARIWYSFNGGTWTDTTVMTDFSAAAVPAGEYQVKLVKEGYVDWVQSQTLNPGGTINFNAVLIPNTGNITVKSNPLGAEIWYSLNGGAWTNSGQTTNFSVPSVPAGSYQVRLVKAGFADWLATQTLLPGGEIVFDATLSPAPKSIDGVPPFGVLERIEKTGDVVGWALDLDTKSQSIPVQFFIDGEAGQGGINAGSVLTDKLQSQVNAQFGVTGMHAFSWKLPDSFLDGKPHSLYVYALDDAGGANALLYQSPMTFSIKAGTGDIVVTSTPEGAAIFYSMDGGSWIDTGVTTNFTFERVQAGSYQVKLVKAGYADWVQTQSLPVGGSIAFHGSLTAATGDITVLSTPPGAKIWYSVDGGSWVDTGVASPHVFAGVPTGNYQVKLVKEGFADWLQSQSLSAGGAISFNGTLTPTAGTIVVNSAPDGARIYYAYNDGIWNDTGLATNFTFAGAPAGKYQVKLIKAGFADWVETKTLVAGGSLAFDATLMSTTDNDPHATGLIPPTPEQEAWEQANMIIPHRIKLNDLGLSRINADRLSKGEEPLVPGSDLAPLGEEVEGETAVQLAEKGQYAEPLGAPAALPSFIDNSTLKYFPPIRSQGGLGSCAQWAGMYYCFTHMNALARNLDAKTGGDAVRFSPKFTYNLVNRGKDGGSWQSDGWTIAANHGAATWADWPYDDDYKGWPLTAHVWRNALNARVDRTGWVQSVDTAVGMDQMKTLLVNGYVLTFATYVNSWRYKNIANDPSTKDDDAYVGKYAAYWVDNSSSAGHAMTVVGYNDAIWIDINANGFVDAGEKGALRIANSWGPGWWEGGFTWLAYDALKAVSDVSGGPSSGRREGWWGSDAQWVTAKPSYTPTAVAQFTLNHPQRNKVSVKLGVSSTDQTVPESLFHPHYIFDAGVDTGAFAFDGGSSPVDGTFVMDYSKIAPSGEGIKRWYLRVAEKGPADGKAAFVKDFKWINPMNGQEVSSPMIPGSVDGDTAHYYVDAAKTATTGEISVNSSPGGARIWYSLDESDWVDSGKVTNETFQGVPAGRYKVKLVKPGYADWIQTQTLEVGKKITFEAALTSESASVTVNSTPAGARVWYSFNDGPWTDSTVLTNISFDAVPAGKYQVKLVKEGYADWIQTQTVTVGGSVTFDATLVPVSGDMKGTITVNSTPTGASIWYSFNDGPWTDSTAMTNVSFTEIPVGKYQVKLVKEGYADWVQTQTLTAGGTLIFEAALSALGNATVTSTPSGAEIWYSNNGIDWTNAGVATPHTFTGIPVGSYYVKLVKTGYVDGVQTRTVTAGTTAIFEFNLTPVSGEESGTIMVNSSPIGARIWYSFNSGIWTDSEQDTPHTFNEIPVGNYQVKLVKAGHAESTTEVQTLSAGGSVTFSGTLSPIGSATVTSIPDGAQIWFSYNSGAWTDAGVATPYTFNEIPAGSYQVKLVKAGHAAYTTEVQTLSAGGSVTFSGTLSPIGSATVTSIPDGAQIWFSYNSGAWTDAGVATPYTFNEIPAGSYQVKLVKSGYADLTTEVQTLTGGGTLTFSGTMNAVGSATVTSVPAGAQIWFSYNSGAWTDTGVTTPYTFNQIPTGTYQVKLVKSGYADYTTEVQTLSTGGSVAFSGTLSPVGSSTVTSIPSGAQIWFSYNGGAWTDAGVTTPYTFNEIPTGNYQVKLVKAGYADYTTGVQTLTGGGSLTFSGSLAAVGSATVTSSPAGAQIWFSYNSGAWTDTGVSTPYTFNQIATGNYQVKLVKAGYADYTTGVQTLTGGGSLTFSGSLAAVGSATVTSSPAGAQIWFSYNSGAWTDTGVATPYTFNQISTGNYQVKLVKAGYADYTTGVQTLTGGGSLTFSGSLAAVGSATVTSSPAGAQIWFSYNSGAWTDTGVATPYTFNQIATGNYQVKLVKAGYADYTTGVQTLSAGGSVTFSPTMTPNTGNVTVNSTPAGAAIWYSFNGGGWTDAGVTTPYTFNGIGAGNYQVKLLKAGYTDYTTGVQTLNGGGSVTFSATLTAVPTTGSISVTSAPTGARIYFQYNGGDWTDSGQVTPYTWSGLTPGTYKVGLVKLGYVNTDAGTQSLVAGGSLNFFGSMPPQ